jgi:ribonuclease BN (tRNA processing enzyme)
LWIDTGSGSLAALLTHSSLEELDAVWVSHTHADHFSDLAVTFYALRYADISRPPLPVFGPPGWAERLRTVLTHTSAPSPIEDAFEIHEVEDGSTTVVCDLELTAFEVLHDAPCFGVRASANGFVVGYTGDTGPCERVAELAEGVDLLISEAGYGLVAPHEPPLHLTAAQAGALSANAQAARLLLTHLAGADVDECTAAAEAAGAREVVAARPGLVIDLSRER